jgi:hypothetical protein
MKKRQGRRRCKRLKAHDWEARHYEAVKKVYPTGGSAGMYTRVGYVCAGCGTVVTRDYHGAWEPIELVGSQP